MHPAVELLIKRMESNPEEFTRGIKSRKWETLIERYQAYMTKEDRNLVRGKYSEIQMKQCHKEIMAELLRSEEKTEDPFLTKMTLPF